MRTCPFKNPKALAIAKSHNASVAQVCLRWIMQKGCIMAVGTGSNPKQVAAYAVRQQTISPSANARLIFTLRCCKRTASSSVCAVYVLGGRLYNYVSVFQEENLGMFNITLTDADMEALNKM